MPNILSERIAALRKERGLTQEQLGRLVGVSYQAVGKLLLIMCALQTGNNLLMM